MASIARDLFGLVRRLKVRSGLEALSHKIGRITVRTLEGSEIFLVGKTDVFGRGTPSPEIPTASAGPCCLWTTGEGGGHFCPMRVEGEIAGHREYIGNVVVLALACAESTPGISLHDYFEIHDAG